MNQAARRVIVRSIYQLEVERLAAVARREALEQELRTYDQEIASMISERAALLDSLGELTPEERTALSSARDAPSQGQATPIRAPTPRPPRQGASKRASRKEPRQAPASTMVLVTDDYTVFQT